MRRLQTSALRGAFFALFLVTTSGVAAARTSWYVDAATGVDNATTHGKCPQTPFRTINFAIQQAVPSNTPDIVNVMPGIYSQRVVVDRPVRLEGLPGAIIQMAAGQGIGIEITPIHSGMTNTNTVVRGLHIDGCNGQITWGIYVHPGTAGNAMSPMIEMNEIADCYRGVFLYATAPAAAYRPTLRHNFIYRTICTPHANHLETGVLMIADNTSMSPHLRSNRIVNFEYGVRMYSNNGGVVLANLECDAISRNEFGVLAGSDSHAQITNETIAFSEPFSAVGVAYGVLLGGTGTADIANSIVWVPDGTGPFGPWTGVDVSSGCSVDGFSIIEDVAPTLNPSFLSPSTEDYHLTSSSPAINNGNTAIVTPGGLKEIDYDLDGDPRILDPFRTHSADVDVGADEYTPIRFDLTLGASPTPNYQPIVDVTMGSSFTIHAQGNTNDAFSYWIDYPQPWNALLPDLGNVLATNAILYVLLPPNGTGIFNVTIPVGSPFTPYAPDTLFDLQGALIDYNTISTPPYLGAMTRRIRLDFNRNPTGTCPP